VPTIEDYPAATLRHFADAESLAKKKRWVGAAHLIGFAAECAIKHKIKSLRPQHGAPHGHLPDLLTTARRHLSRRRDTAFYAVLKVANLMQGWDVSLRYSQDSAVDEAQYSLWRDHAARLLGAAGLRRPN